MSAVLGEELGVLDYPAKLVRLQSRGVGLWDVVARAHREGSLDSGIRGRVDNDVEGLLDSYPGINTIGFNGTTALRIGRRILERSASRAKIVALPSSSAAYTLAMAEKISAWMTLRPHIDASLDSSSMVSSPSIRPTGKKSGTPSC